MNKGWKFHRQAMEFADEAFLAKRRGETNKEREYTLKAYELESEAAYYFIKKLDLEPTRSVLFRSAATLALRCHKFREAEQLIAHGLGGNPPSDIASELRELWEKVNFSRHLEIKGETLSAAELRMAISGNAVGYGMILYDDLNSRVDPVTHLLNKTGQRLTGRPYQQGGRVPEQHRPFTQAIGTLPPSSFAIKISLVVPKGQQEEMFLKAEEVIDEVLLGIELINNSEEERLRDHIKDDKYYRDFVNRAKCIAPDGKDIKQVGFTSPNRTVGFIRTSNDIKIETSASLTVEPKAVPKPEPTQITITGIVDYMKLRGDDHMGVTTEDGKHYRVYVDEGLDDLISNNVRKWVIITGQDHGDYIHLTDFNPIK